MSKAIDLSLASFVRPPALLNLGFNIDTSLLLMHTAPIWQVSTIELLGVNHNTFSTNVASYCDISWIKISWYSFCPHIQSIIQLLHLPCWLAQCVQEDTHYSCSNSAYIVVCLLTRHPVCAKCTRHWDVSLRKARGEAHLCYNDLDGPLTIK